MVKTARSDAMPLVSVVMPSYNAEIYIEQAIRSVMEQSVTDWELLVIDDGSRDSSCEIIERLAEEDGRILFLKNPENMGVAKTRNRGLELCRGQYVALLDSDDIWHRQKLEKQLEIFRQTGADLVYTSYAIIDGAGKKAKEDYIVPARVDFEKLLRENVIGCSTVMLRGDVLSNYRFAEDYYHEDYILWLELLRSGHIAAGCTEPQVDWRLIQNSRSFDKRRSAGYRWRIYRDYLKLPLLKSIRVFGAYATASLRKYFGHG